MTAGSLRVGRDLTVDDRRTAILRVAVACIAQTGHDNVRLRDVAKGAGVSIGSLQHYFETRDELVSQSFQQASEDLLAEWATAVDTVPSPSPWHRLQALVTQVARGKDVRAHCLVWIQFATAAARDPSVRTRFAEVYSRWHGLVRSAVEDGVTTGLFQPVLDIDDVVEILLNHIDGCELNIASGTESITGERMSELTMRLASKLLAYSPG